MDRGFWAKIWDDMVQRWPSENPRPRSFLSLSQEKIKVGFWPWVVRWSKGSCFKSTKVNPWHSQTANRSITGHFSIDQNHQGPFQRCRSNIWQNPKMSRFPMDVPRPPPRMVRLWDLESAWKCSRSDGLEMRIPKVTWKSQIGHLSQKLGPSENDKISSKRRVHEIILRSKWWLQTRPNMKGRHLGHISNQPKPTGSVSEKFKFTPFWTF